VILSKTAFDPSSLIPPCGVARAVRPATKASLMALIRHELRAEPEDLLVLEIDGQSMEPLLYSRDQVIANRRKRSFVESGTFALHDRTGIVMGAAGAQKRSAAIRLSSENLRFDLTRCWSRRRRSSD
jgi:hypothetical protein